MKQTINSFSGGISQDVSINKYPRDRYYWAQNVRLISKKGLKSGALVNVDGTKLKLTFPTDHSIVSFCTIRDTIIFFVYSPTAGKIYKWDYNSSDTTESPTLIYSHAGLVFDTNNPVRSVGRYETETVQKIYFSDGLTYFKYLNIIPQEGDSYPLSATIGLEEMDLVPDVMFSNMTLNTVTGGSLKVGKIQYAYQLYFKRGSETIYSPASNLIHITEYTENTKSSDYLGSEVGAIANKSVTVTINNIDSKFTRLRLVALEYPVLHQQPNIRIVGEYNIENLSSIILTDSGNSIGSLTMEEFRFLSNNFYPKTLDTKNNILFAGNVKNEYFDITDDEFDARAFRADSSDVVKVMNGNNELTIPHTAGVFSPEGVPLITDEQFNEFNDLTNDFYNSNLGDETTKKYKYKPGTNVLGGKGLYIEYDFITKTVVLDDSPKTYNYGTALPGSFYPKLNAGVSDPYQSNASPNAPVGYMRDEIYRFGIIFLDPKGRESFVKWIGDIRFPSNREPDFAAFYYDVTTNSTMARILGINFKVTIPEVIKSKISGYRIVRAERTDSDKTIVAQGLIGYPIRKEDSNIDNGANNTKHNYSLPTQPTALDMLYKQIKYARTAENYNNISSALPYVQIKSTFKLDEKFIQFDSPDVVFKKQELPMNDAYVELFAVQNKVETTAIAGIRGYETSDIQHEANAEKDVVVGEKTRNLECSLSLPRGRAMIYSNKIYTAKSKSNLTNDANNDATKTVLNGGFIYNNQCYAPTTNTENTQEGNDVKSKFAIRGTHALLEVDNVLPINNEWVNGISEQLSFPVANYKVNRVRNLYGGSDYSSRILTKYYPASEFVDKDTVFDTSVPPTPDIPNPKIQLISHTTGTLIEPGGLVQITNVKFINVVIQNYGTTNLTINSISLSDSSIWVISDNPVGQIIGPGNTTMFTLSYIGPETEFSYGAVTINSNSVVNASLVFTALVDYVNYPDDVFGSENEPLPLETPTVNPPVTTGGVQVFNGDTYISYFAYNRAIYDIGRGIGQRIDVNQFYPVESTINLHLRLDNIQKYINWGLFRDGYVSDYKLMENLSEGVLTYNNNYPTDVGNLYRYNTAYSVIDKSKEYYSKPFDFENTVTYDTRIVASEKKINGEYIDSWTKFKFNNLIDVDSRYGALTRLLTFKNELYYFQPLGVGVVAVNQRSIIQDNQPGALALGTGGVLERFDYLSDKSGCEIHDAIVASDDFIFFADSRRKRINKFVQGSEMPVSLVKGIDSTLDGLLWNYVRAGFDRKNNEVIFSFDNKTIAFNEIADAFTSEYTFSPRFMFSLGKAFFSVGRSGTELNSPWIYTDNPEDVVNYSDDSGDYIILASEGGVSDEGLYKHDVGEPGLFYDAATPGDSYITLIINPEGNTICYFDNLDLRTESVMYDDDTESPTYQTWIDSPADIFYKLEASNAYQAIDRDLSFTLGSLAGNHYNDGTIKRIGRLWRTPIMQVQGENSSFKRMVDTYVKITLRYNNSSGNIFTLHDIACYYRPTQL